MEISNAVMNQNKPLLKQLTVHETIYLEFLKAQISDKQSFAKK